MRDFDEHNPRIRIIFGLVTLLIVIGGVWLAAGFIWPEDNGQIAILKADNTPYKVKPDQPGGMQIPHQDKLIFNTVSSEGKMVTVERILPGPEAPLNAQPSVPEIPVPVPVTPAAPNAAKPADKVTEKPSDKPAEKTAEKTPDKAAPLPTTSPKIDAPVAAMGRVIEATPDAKPAAAQPAKPPAAFDMSKGEPQPLVKPTPIPEEEPAPANETMAKEPTVKEPFVKETVNEEEPVVDTSGPKSKARVKDAAAKEPVEEQQDDNEPEPPKAAASSGKAHFQLASFFDRPSADKGLAQFKSKYANELQGASLSIATATINGGKQVFRIQGSASSAATASDICSDIKAKGGSCVTIR